MRTSGTPTKYPGVLKLRAGKYRIRGKVLDPRTGQRKEVDRVLENVTLQQAARKRAEMLEEARHESTPVVTRVRVGEYAQSWMKSKALKVGPGTARTYADALEMHILPVFGDFYYHALTSRDVQKWIDEVLTREWVTDKGKRKRYARNSVHVWFRVLRAMTRDAMEDLRLERDPTLRISFPEAPEPVEPNSLTPDELLRFLEAMRARYPQHYALTVVLAYTGLRFCHGSALRWDDWDEEAGVLQVVRKQVRGKIGPVSRKKRAPRVIPIEAEIVAVLREHRARVRAELGPESLAQGWMFPSTTGTLRAPSSVSKAWKGCLKAAKITKRFTVHGLRYTFTDLIRRAKVDAVVRRALVGHVTEQMQHHYSTVGLDEKRAAVAGVARLVPLRVHSLGRGHVATSRFTEIEPRPALSGSSGGDFGGDRGRNDSRPVRGELATGLDH